jgi:endonuclease-3 related protein
MVGAILTQNTAWTNVKKAIINLKQHHCLSPENILACTSEDLARYLKPAGYFNVKAQRLQNFCQWYLAQGAYAGLAEMGTQSLRAKLLAVKGIGPETADDILLYAFNRPIFVIDAYTRRLLQRHALITGKEDYETLRALFERNLMPDTAMYNEYHALIVHHAKVVCRKSKPLCEQCCLRMGCSYIERSF